MRKVAKLQNLKFQIDILNRFREIILCSIPMVRRPSVVIHNFKHEYLCNQWADHNQILSEASLGWGKGCIRFWARSDQNSAFHGNRKLSLGNNGENGVSTFSRLFFFRSFSYLQAMMTCTRAQTSSNFGLIGPWTAELAALDRLKKNPIRL